MIRYPTTVYDDVVKIATVDTDEIKSSLQKYIDLLTPENRQYNLRWAGNNSGTGDLRDTVANPKKLHPLDFVDWQPDTEYIQEITKKFDLPQAGRVRLLLLPARSAYSYHSDPDRYRVHIPLITDESAMMIIDGQAWHLPTGYMYQTLVGKKHTAINCGVYDRIHLVWDWLTKPLIR